MRFLNMSAPTFLLPSLSTSLTRVVHFLQLMDLHWQIIILEVRGFGQTYNNIYPPLTFYDTCSICVETVLSLVAQPCPNLCDPTDCSPPSFSVHGDSPGKNIGVGRHSLLQIFPIQRSTQVSHPAGGFFTDGATREALITVWCYRMWRKGGSVAKNPPANARDEGLILELRKSPGEENGNPLQYSCLWNIMDRGHWWATVHGVTKELDMT